MRLSRDLILVPCANPGRTCETSELMMARVQPGGIFELLSPAAWARTLGYELDELRGKSLCELMPLEKHAAGEVVDVLLDEKNVQSLLQVTLRCKDERRKRFSLYRRFDAYEGSVFVVADELVDSPVEPRAAYA